MEVFDAEAEALRLDLEAALIFPLVQHAWNLWECLEDRAVAHLAQGSAWGTI